MTGWREARAQMHAGDRVRFVMPWDIYPYCIVPAGTVGTVTEVSDEQNGMVLVLPDDTDIRDTLAEWDGAIQVWALEDEDECPIAKVTS
jgi:hypothetical protein